MKHKDQIQELIQSKTGSNNCLALQLMLNLCKYSFEEALLMLEFKKSILRDYTIDLIDIKIGSLTIFAKSRICMQKL